MVGWNQLMTCRPITGRDKLLPITMRNRRLGISSHLQTPINDQSSLIKAICVIIFILDFKFKIFA